VAFFFAYGDRMNEEKMIGEKPNARLVGPARLGGYRLAFNVISRAWGGGAANAVPDPRGNLWGILWELEEGDLEGLEPINRGGGPNEDRVLNVDVEGPDGTVTARTFAVESHEAFVRPTERYFDMLRATAVMQGLPEEAIEAMDRARETPAATAPQI
jgi:gamma-glutamylcyclotransferase